MMGLVPATRPGNKSQGQFPSCELAIFATKCSRRDLNLVPATYPMNSNWFEFLGQVPATCPRNAPCELFVGLVPATSSFV